MALLDESSQSYKASLAIWDHTVLYLPPDSSELPPPKPSQTGLKAKLTYVVGNIARWFTCQQTGTYPTSNRGRCRATSWVRTNELTTIYATATPPQLMLNVTAYMQA